jgi:hypothetical protein
VCGPRRHPDCYKHTPVNKAVLRGLLTREQIAVPALDELRIDVVADRGCAVRGTLPASPNPSDSPHMGYETD